MRGTHIYPAILRYEEEGITVLFPDLEGCITCGSNQEEALKNAVEALGLHLWGFEQDNEDIPKPTSIKDIKPNENEVITLISVYMPTVRDRLNNKAVKVTVTIPKWLKTEAENENISFSQVLQDGLKVKLGK